MSTRPRLVIVVSVLLSFVLIGSAGAEEKFSKGDLEKLNKGEIVYHTRSSPEEGILYGVATEMIATDFERLWSFLTDYSIHDKYFQPVGTRKAYEIVAKGDDHYTVRKMEVPFMSPQLTLLFHHDKAHRRITGRMLNAEELTPELVRSGAVAPKRLDNVHEFWEIENSPFPGDPRLMVTYGLYIDHSLWIPGLIQRRILRSNVKKVVEIAHDAMATQAKP